MALDFPNSPIDGQTYSQGGINYVYNANSTAWLIDSTQVLTGNLAYANAWTNTSVAGANAYAGQIANNANTLHFANTTAASITYGGTGTTVTFAGNIIITGNLSLLG